MEAGRHANRLEDQRAGGNRDFPRDQQDQRVPTPHRVPAGLPQVMCDLPREDGNRGEQALLNEHLDELVGDAAALQQLLDQIPRVAVDSPAVPDRQIAVNLELLAAAQLVPAGGRSAPRGTREIVRRAGTGGLEVPREGVQNRGGVAAVAVAAGVARRKGGNVEGRGVVELAEHGALLRVAELLEGLVVAERLVAARCVGAAVGSHAVGLGVGVDFLEKRGKVEALRGELVQLGEGVRHERLQRRRGRRG